MGKKQKDKKEKKVLTLSEFNAEIAPNMPSASVVLPDAPLGAEEWEKQGIPAYGKRAGQVPRDYHDRGDRGGDRDHEGGGGRYGGRGEGEEEEERDWTRRGPLEQLPRGAGQGGFRPRGGELDEEGGARREERDLDWGERRGPMGPSGGRGPVGMTDNAQGPREELDWSQRRGPVAAEPSLHPQANVDWSNVRRGAPPPTEQPQGGRPHHPDVDFRDVRGTAKVEVFTSAPAHANIDFKDARGTAKAEPSGPPRQDIDFRDVRGSAKVEPVHAHPGPQRDTEFKDVRGSAQVPRPRERDTREHVDSKDIDWSVRKAPVESASPETRPHDASPAESGGSDHQQQPRYRERGAPRGGYHENRGDHGERSERYHNHGPKERDHNDHHGQNHQHEHKEQDWSAVRTGDGIPAQPVQPAQPADMKSASPAREEVTWKTRRSEGAPNVDNAHREDRKGGERVNRGERVDRGERVERGDRGDRGERGDHRRPVGEKKPNRDVDWSQRRGPIEAAAESENGKASSSAAAAAVGAAPVGGDSESNVQYRPRVGPPRRRNERGDRNKGDDDQGQWVKVVPPSVRTFRKDERGGNRRGGKQVGGTDRPRGEKPAGAEDEGDTKDEKMQTAKLDAENPFEVLEEAKEGEAAATTPNGDAPSTLEAGA